MPDETRRFFDVDKSWRNIMLGLYENPLISELDAEKTRNDLENNNKLLGQVQKALSDYLE
jgi:hypothetical protein